MTEYENIAATAAGLAGAEAPADPGAAGFEPATKPEAVTRSEAATTPEKLTAPEALTRPEVPTSPGGVGKVPPAGSDTPEDAAAPAPAALSPDASATPTDPAADPVGPKSELTYTLWRTDTGDTIMPRVPSAGVTSFALKMVAIVCMTANHAVWILGDIMPLWLTYVLYGLGGATFPIMAFMLVEGFRHTSNLRKYGARLLLWAVIAAVPFFLFLGHPEANLYGDVLFTLFGGLCLIATKATRGPLPTLAVAVVVLAGSYFCDWALVGPVLVFCLYITNASPKNREATLVCMLVPMAYVLLNCALVVFQLAPLGVSLGYIFRLIVPDLLYGLVGCSIAAALLWHYKGQLGRPLAGGSAANGFNWHTLVKWGFYAYYPLHITVLGLIAMALGLR